MELVITVRMSVKYNLCTDHFHHPSRGTAAVQDSRVVSYKAPRTLSETGRSLSNQYAGIWSGLSHIFHQYRVAINCMHPSKVVSICLFAVGIVELAGLFAGPELQITVTATVQALGAILFITASLVGFFRYDSNPIVTDYDWKSYLMIAGSVMWTIGSLIQLNTL